MLTAPRKKRARIESPLDREGTSMRELKSIGTASGNTVSRALPPLKYGEAGGLPDVLHSAPSHHRD